MGIAIEVLMMKKRALVLFLGVFLLLSAAVFAQVIAAPTFFVTTDAVNDVIMDPKENHADFYIVVENKGPEPDTYKLLYLEDPKWSYQVLPGPLDKQITVAPGEKGKIHVLVKGNVPKGIYSVKVSVQSLSSKNIIENVMHIRVGETAPGDAPRPDFDVDVSVPAQMDPRGAYNVIVNIKNNNERLLEDVHVKIASKILSEETNVTVQPGETKSVSFAVILMDNIKPQQDQLHATVDYEGEEFHSSDHNFEVVEYVPPFKTSIDVDRKFLRQDRVITITNDGNAKKSDTVRLETSLKERFFSSSTPKFQIVKEAGKYYFAWGVSLNPEESTEIHMKTSYRLLLLIALIIIAFIVYKLALANPLIVRKKVKSVHKEHGGAISDLSVVIFLKNRGKEPISNIRIVERITKMVKLKKDSFEGSMHPVKMHEHDHEGTLLEYRFGELSPGDTRIITYKVYAKLHLFGTVTIKPTVAEFSTKKGKKKSRSNEVSVATDEQVSRGKPVPPKPHKPAHESHHEHKEHHDAHHTEHHK
jgi:hypothetical protein